LLITHAGFHDAYRSFLFLFAADMPVSFPSRHAASYIADITPPTPTP